LSYYAKGVIDIVNGLALKIGSQGEILTAFKGFKKLKRKEIEELYGENGHVPEFNFRENNHQNQFQIVTDFYKAAVLSFYIYFVEMRE